MLGSIKQFTARTCFVSLLSIPLALFVSCKAAKHWSSGITILSCPCHPSVFPLKIGPVHELHHDDNCCYPLGSEDHALAN